MMHSSLMTDFLITLIKSTLSKRDLPRLRIQFAKGGKAIAAINDLQSGAKYDRAELEPELISAVTGKERAKRRVIGFNDIPKDLVNAITVTEDRDFFNHYGVNIRGIIRALIKRYDSDPNSPISRSLNRLPRI